MRKFFTFVSMVFLTGILFTYQNCSKHDTQGISESELLAIKVEEFNVQAHAIFDSKCLACHQSKENAQIKDFKTESLIEEQFIVAGDPQLSPLYVYLIDGHYGIPSDARPEISGDEFDFLRDWILYQDPLYFGDDALGKDYEIIIPVVTAPNRTDGEIIFERLCQRCHGPVATSEKRNRSAIQIRNAIDGQAQMNIPALRALTAEQIDSLVAALAD